MVILTYLTMVLVTFFTFLFVYTKVFEPIDTEDPEDFVPGLFIAIVIGGFWPIGFPVCALGGLGWYFLKFLNKGKK